ncbi:PTS lactose transporter subunit IIBC [Lacticaseibacillus zeae]|uniref:PTS system lactose-specific EIICB component n=1 Tax=Lacticaseibacillus zeae subsp. silagei TaxID=3068307 RepID=A0ABD7Z9Z8_LACZE|nr:MULTISPECIES: PTS lactose transporter subunit IIBC [Lacticaseibacillus]MDE3314347.1 PTS lactose transporter subunit IIBC [Lacticaseibacillus zeae]OFS01324.1 PTS lactose transporter subunit IIBC [Lactobacillus sp. HMSC068F07]WLV83979.1 PTS lactose transporter subunit IIBC [Lacticaseibacillus sp. NCIMB 15475]WLV86735.1 PTS lactose transporter subunit IIBC [Lacticaseibacillus sp. NCIMB 15474]
MQVIVKRLEKHQALFEKISRNIYLMAIKDGFLAAMPIILFSSIFILLSNIPPLIGIKIPTDLNAWFNKIYNYTMGFVGFYVAGTTAKALTGSMNQRIKGGRFINNTSTMMAAMVGFMLLVIGTTGKGNFLPTFFGTQGILSAFVAAFVTVWVYKFCVERDLTIKMPKEVPGAISQNFRDIIPFGAATIVFSLIDVAARAAFKVPFSAILATVLAPVFKGAETYPGMMLIWFLIPMFWFLGVHGPSVVKPALESALFGNTTANLALFKAGHFPYHALTENFGNFVGELGGTGATFIVPFLFMFFMKSKQLKAIGKASFIPVMFAVNEPLLFGAPIILNPYFLVPFVLAPVVNVVIGKAFIDLHIMHGFMYFMSWALPGPIGALIDTGFQWTSLVLMAILLVVDALIYMPFIRAYDAELLQQEAAVDAADAGAVATATAAGTGEVAAEADAATAQEFPEPTDIKAAKAENASTADEKTENGPRKLDHELKVLVLCAGGGTSEQLANALTDGAKTYHEPIVASAGAYGSHHDILPNYDMVVLAPQVRTYYSDLKHDTDRLGIKLVATKGQQYIALTRDPEKALDFVVNHYKESDTKEAPATE